ncbi:YwpF family protein [Chungangia koreensis]|uniref:YwpF family protein n=1 Tax=Chungangia koreensis TaxID=752657 RepID=A0ABV8X559_9LACT
MKSFKMLTIGVVENEEIVDYPLQDGICINQENSHRSWILEAYTDRKFKEIFEKYEKSQEPIDVRVVISYPENEPAAFNVVVYAVKEIGENISVLMKGTLKRIRSQYAEQLLEQLLEEGLSDGELLEGFKEGMKSRPRLKKDRT